MVRRAASFLNFGAVVHALAVAVTMAPRRQSHVEAVSPTNGSCTDIFTSANASGISQFMSPQISALEKMNRGGPGNNALNWALTVNGPGASEAPDQFDNIVWLGTPQDVNLDDGNNPFSACGMLFTDIPTNTRERGQSDDGSCNQTLDPNCVSALTSKASAIAMSLTAGCTPGANSNCSIAEICPAIFSQLGTQAGFVPECVPYFDIGNNNQAWPSANVTAITSNVGDFSQEICAIEPHPQTKFTFVPTFNLTNNLKSANNNESHNIQTYNNLTTAVYPILSVFMPPANGTRADTFQNATSQMACLRATNFSDGSLTPSALPQPTPVVIPSNQPPSHGLNSGETAGIAVGCVAFVALVAAAAWYYWRRRRIAEDRAEASRLAANAESVQTSSSPGMTSTSVRSGNPFGSQNASFTSDPSGGSSELPPDSVLTVHHQEPVELPSDPIARPVEMNSSWQPAEVPAHEARVRQSLASPSVYTPATETPASAYPLGQRNRDSVAETPASAYPVGRSGHESATRSIPPPTPWSRNAQHGSTRGWMTPVGATPEQEEPRDI